MAATARRDALAGLRPQASLTMMAPARRPWPAARSKLEPERTVQRRPLEGMARPQPGGDAGSADAAPAPREEALARTSPVARSGRGAREWAPLPATRTSCPLPRPVPCPVDALVRRRTTASFAMETNRPRSALATSFRRPIGSRETAWRGADRAITCDIRAIRLIMRLCAFRLHVVSLQPTSRISGRRRRPRPASAPACRSSCRRARQAPARARSASCPAAC